MLSPKRGTKPRGWGFSRGAGRIPSIAAHVGWSGWTARAAAICRCCRRLRAGHRGCGGPRRRSVHRLAVGADGRAGDPGGRRSAGHPTPRQNRRNRHRSPASLLPVSQTVRRSLDAAAAGPLVGEPRYEACHSAAHRGAAGAARAPPRGADDDEDQRPRYGATFRSVCVRLCDGYYFPISFAVTSDRLERDAQVCASRCGSQGRLFVHNNPGGSAERHGGPGRPTLPAAEDGLPLSHRVRGELHVPAAALGGGVAGPPSRLRAGPRPRARATGRR